ncbi:MAG: hypothetical protein DWI22_22280 [Planctomycetota bacterium]|nr:MAG: hypothetical protein DWI22_22280 [Planctomycetota bacterium]
MPARDENPDAAPNVAELPTPPECTKGVRNRLLTSVGDLGIVELWEDQNDQFRVVGFIMY